MTDYQTIKATAKKHGIRVEDLCALSPSNDPFFVGRKSQIKAARWFADLWERFGYSTGVHLRRVHYQIVSQDPPLTRPDGTAYENTERDWNYLCNAAKWARYLNLVDPAAFVDRRNPDAIVYADYYGDPAPGYEVYDPWGFAVDLPDFPDLPELQATGYTEGNLQPYHVEVWVEKSTMHDVLKPLCRQYGVNLIAGLGEMSITAVVSFLRRVRGANRPARILYVSDFDPAGLSMPISVARKIEFFQRRNGGDMDICLQPIALTSEQVATYDLPRVPVKDSDLRKANWEADHGPGQVELDALEALHPGELERIVRDAILQYHDLDLQHNAAEEKRNLRRDLETASDEALADLQPEIDRLRAEFDGAVSAFRQSIERLDAELPILHDEIVRRLEAVEIDVDDYPLPEPDTPPESDGKLYVSGRDYLEQLDCYKAHRHGGEL